MFRLPRAPNGGRPAHGAHWPWSQRPPAGLEVAIPWRAPLTWSDPTAWWSLRCFHHPSIWGHPKLSQGSSKNIYKKKKKWHQPSTFIKKRKHHDIETTEKVSVFFPRTFNAYAFSRANSGIESQIWWCELGPGHCVSDVRSNCSNFIPDLTHHGA